MHIRTLARSAAVFAATLAALSAGLSPVATAGVSMVAPSSTWAYATTDTNELWLFDRTVPGTIAVSIGITGLDANTVVHGIDFRPATGELLALGIVDAGSTQTGRLYRLDPPTAVATPVGVAFSSTLPDALYWEIDVDPVADEVRVVSSSGQNLWLDPDTGQLARTGAAIAPGSAFGVAYSPNQVGSSAVTAFAYDWSTDRLATLADDGTMTVAPMASGVVLFGPNPFDIAPGATVGYLTGGAGGTGLFSIDLATGAATVIGTVGDGSATVTGLALPAEAVTVDPSTLTVDEGSTAAREVRVQGSAAGTVSVSVGSVSQTEPRVWSWSFGAVDESDSTTVTFSAPGAVPGSFDLVVENVAPSVSIDGIVAGRRGETVTVSASASDPGVADALTFGYAVTLGGLPVASGSGVDLTSFEFVPDQGGSYEVTVTVDDGDGGSASASSTFEVAGSGVAALVTGNAATLPGPDAPFVALLQGLGLTVQLVDDNALDLASAVSAAQPEVVLVSSSVRPGLVGTRLRDLAVPIIVSEGVLFDEFAMSSRGGNGERTAAAIGVVLEPLAGPVGPVAVFTRNTQANWLRPAGDATVGLTWTKRSDQVSLAWWDTGDGMADGRTAPAPRVAAPATFASSTRLTPAGVALYTNLISWAIT